MAQFFASAQAFFNAMRKFELLRSNLVLADLLQILWSLAREKRRRKI